MRAAECDIRGQSIDIFQWNLPIVESGHDLHLKIRPNQFSRPWASQPQLTAKGIQDAIIEAGFEPQLRTQQYEYRELPANMVEQVINY